jgi:hypothetical protein
MPQVRAFALQGFRQHDDLLRSPAFRDYTERMEGETYALAKSRLVRGNQVVPIASRNRRRPSGR